MPVIDADVVLSMWLGEKNAPRCIDALSEIPATDSIIMADFNVLEVVLRAGSVLQQSTNAAFHRLQQVCRIENLTPEELLEVVNFRTAQPSLTLGDSYSAALSYCRQVPLFSTDKRFTKIKRLKDLLWLI